MQRLLRTFAIPSWPQAIVLLLAFTPTITTYADPGLDPAPNPPEKKRPEKKRLDSDVDIDSKELEQVRIALLERRGGDAAREIESLLGQGGDDSLFLMLQATALRLGGEDEKALAVLERLLRQADGQFRHKAIFARADILARARKFDEAVKIYTREVLRLTSVERKRELAAIYTRFADRYFSDEKPAYGKARDFYTRALEIGPAAEDIERLRLRIGLCHFRANQFAEAAKHFESELAARPKGELADQMTLELGNTRIRLGNLLGARRAFLDLVREFPTSPLIARATYNAARTYGIPSPVNDANLERGLRFLREIVAAKEADSKLRSRAAFEIGLSYFRRGRDEDAIGAFRKVIAEFGKLPDVAEVPLAYARIGDAAFRQKKFPDAVEAWKEFLSAFPAHGEWRATQQKIIDVEFTAGLEAFRKKRYNEAASAWERFLDRYPLDARSPQIHLRIGKIHYEKERYEDAIGAWGRLVSKYPGTQQSSEGQYWIGVTLEKKLGRFDEAREAYRKLTWGGYTGRAKQRIAALDSKHLSALSERSFRTNETANLRVTTRNIPSLELRLYRLDAESYFRKMHTFGGMENLELALIEPDENWTFPIPDYEKHREAVSDIPLPITDAGLYVVTAGEDELEATTVILVTDVFAAVQSGRRDTLVYAQDALTGKPAAKTRVLVSDGKRIVFEGETDERGFYHSSSDQLRSATDLRVFVRRESDSGPSYGGTSIGLHTSRFVDALQPKGYVYTERPVYRPGEIAHFRGILRTVEDGQYTFAKGEKFRVDVIAASGDIVHTREIELSDVGTFSGDVTLPADSPVGAYRILCHRTDGPSFAGVFEVLQFQIPNVQLEFDLDRQVFFRGEKVEGRILARYSHGGPVRKRSVTYQIPGKSGELRSVTNDEGEVPFSFETRDLAESQTVTLSARIQDESATASRVLWISTTGYTLGVDTLRDVYFPEESFDVTVRARGVDGEKIERDLSLVVVRLAIEDGRRGEVEVARHDLETDDESGDATVQLALAEGGVHLVRVEGKDRFGNRIGAQKRVFVSTKDDSVKLRIISDRERFELGEDASVTLHNRSDAKLAVLTYEGEGIHRYRTVTIEEGANKIDLGLEQIDAPNFRLTALVLDGDRFESTHKEFLVDRGLEIAIDPETSVTAPGTELAVRFRTTDLVGDGASAEVAVALVDAAVLDLFPDRLADLREFFYARRNGISSVANSTAEFKYHGTTRTVSRLVLEEESRAEETALTPRRPGHDLPLLGDEPVLPPELSESLNFLTVERLNDSEGNDFYESSQNSQVGQQMFQGRLQSGLGNNGFAAQQSDSGGVIVTGGFGAHANRSRSSGRAANTSDALRRVLRTATGYWNPSVRTDASGRGKVRIPMPGRQARWKLLVLGVTANTLVGRGETDLETRRDFFLELRHPSSVTEGDEAGVEVVVHNLTNEKRDGAIRFEAKIGERTESFRREVSIDSESTAGELFRIPVHAGDRLELSASFEFEGQPAAASPTAASLEIYPWATELREGAGGVATHAVSHTLKLDAKDVTRRELEISIGPNLTRSFLDLAEPRRHPYATSRLELTSRGLTLLELIDYVGSFDSLVASTRAPLEQELESILASLFVTQREDGGWSWAQKRGSASDPYVSAAAYRVLERAATLGLRSPAKYRNNARAYLEQSFTRADDTTKAVLCYALAQGSSSTEFAKVNRLYRMRRSLSPYALAHLALTLEHMNRKDLSREIVNVLVASDIYALRDTRQSDGSRLGWVEDSVEQVALSVLAVSKISPRSDFVRKGIDWLQSNRFRHQWSTPKATSSAAAALREYLTHVKPLQETYELEVHVGDKLVKTFRFSGGSKSERVVVNGDDLPEGDVRVAFEINGNGRFAYQATLKGRVEGIDKSDLDRFVRTRHTQVPAPRVVDGEKIPSGDRVVTKTSGIQNRFTELTVGETGRVFTRIDNRDGRESYIVHEEYLPAGCELVPGSVHGGFQHYEVHAGRIVFYFGRDAGYGSINYEIYGRLPGTYAVLPSRTYPTFRPDRVTTSEARKIKVLAPGEERSESYRLTPDELYHIGKLHFDRDRLTEAKKPLGKLFDDYRLKDQIYREVARMLLKIAIEEVDSKGVVRYFEVLKERYPELVLSFEDMLKVGDAYTKMKEFERALQVYRGIAEASFVREGNIVGALNTQGEFRAALDLSERLILEYPDLPQVVESSYNLTHFIYQAAARIDKIPELRGSTTRHDLIASAAARLRQFLVFHPSDPKADEAAFTLAAAYLDLGEYERGVGLADRMKSRFPGSSYLDQFLYIAGYARFWLGDYRGALSSLDRVEQEEFPASGGGRAASEDRSLATYLMGQIHHAVRDAQKAIEKYRAVREQFSDADEAIREFERRELSLPEVARVKPGDQVQVKVKFRNIPSVRLIAYKVDLLKLYLLRRNLDGIADVRLAGIKPQHDAVIKLGDGKDYREREHEVELPIKDAGAYLVVVKDGELDASGMVLVSNLELEIGEQVESGRVRATVIRKDDRSYVSRAHVKAIGEGNDKFSSGDTDLRGLYVADGLLGKTTIVAKAGNEYAFYRGKTSLGGYARPVPAANKDIRKSNSRASGPSQKGGQGKGSKMSQKEVLEGNFQLLNQGNISDNCIKLEGWFQNDVAGCSVERVR